MVTATSPNSNPDGGGPTPGVGAQIKGLADDAKHGAQTMAEERKAEGAERLHGVAEAVGRVAEDVKDQSPAIAEFVRKAALGLDGVSQDLKTRSVGDLMEMARTFARREPAAFMAASAVAGFALSRFLKSSAPATPSHRSGHSTAASGAESDREIGHPAPTPAASPQSTPTSLGSTSPGPKDPASSADATPSASRGAEAAATAVAAANPGSRTTVRLEEKGSAI